MRGLGITCYAEAEREDETLKRNLGIARDGFACEEQEFKLMLEPNSAL